MPGKNARFTKKEDRKAKHVADSEKKKGKSAKDAKRIGYATVQKQKRNTKDRNKGSNRRKRNIGRS